jgi:NIMA (never in mitosis gene a)-related kinase
LVCADYSWTCVYPFQVQAAFYYREIIHRDIKGANIFLGKDDVCKVGDFGIAKYSNQTIDSRVFAGTPGYLSPEMVEGRAYTSKADIWAAGVVLYQLCCLKLPFEANSLPILALRILRGNFAPLPKGLYSK